MRRFGAGLLAVLAGVLLAARPAGAAPGYPVPYGFLGPAVLAEMSPSSAFIAKLSRGGVAVPGIAYTNIVTEHDELVVPTLDPAHPRPVPCRLVLPALGP